MDAVFGSSANPHQLQAIQATDGPVLIIAGPGSGKTFTLVERIIYLITQGGPQEKADILVSSMYKAAFQFYRYGFTAMFALVIFAILFAFTLFYLRVSDGLKSASE